MFSLKEAGLATASVKTRIMVAIAVVTAAVGLAYGGYYLGKVEDYKPKVAATGAATTTSDKPKKALTKDQIRFHAGQNCEQKAKYAYMYAEAAQKAGMAPDDDAIDNQLKGWVMKGKWTQEEYDTFWWSRNHGKWGQTPVEARDNIMNLCGQGKV